MHTIQIKAYLALVFALLVYCGQGVVVKILTSDPYGLSGTQIALLRQTLGSLVLLPIVGAATWRHRHILWQNRSFVIRGAFIGFFVQSAALAIGVEYTTALNLYIITALAPAAAVLMSIILYKQTVSGYTLLYIALGIAGVLIIVAKGSLQTLANLQVNIGDILIIICVFSWVYFGFVMNRKPPALPLYCFLLVGLLLASLFTVPLLWINAGTPLTLDMLTWPFVSMVFYLVVLIQILALFAYGYAASVLDGVIPAVGLNLLPLFGSILSVVTLGETFYTYHGVAMILIGISVYKIVARDIRIKKQSQ